MLGAIQQYSMYVCCMYGLSGGICTWYVNLTGAGSGFLWAFVFSPVGRIIYHAWEPWDVFGESRDRSGSRLLSFTSFWTEGGGGVLLLRDRLDCLVSWTPPLVNSVWQCFVVGSSGDRAYMDLSGSAKQS